MPLKAHRKTNNKRNAEGPTQNNAQCGFAAIVTNSLIFKPEPKKVYLNAY
jgi:hypothetical protein